ncbi:GFA family protein [Marinibaculum pumilum]|uniref:GFA family protein n=1 Tax=Marinibaculum pumilum TaxID=1766165 RepID=A0ABV7L8C6_9PROT
MKVEGGCYCGQVRYEAELQPLLKLQCHCRECQYITGGGPNFTMGVPKDGFRYTKGAPKSFTRDDLEIAVTRQFCGNCGTHLATVTPRRPEMVLLKVGSLDDPAVFEGPQAAIFTIDMQPFHMIRDGLPSFERRPG